MARDQGYVTDDVNPNLINSGVTPSQADIAASAAVANGPSGPVNINGKMLTPIYGTKTIDYGGRRGSLEVPDYSNPISYEEYLPNHMVNSYDVSGKLTNTFSNAQGGFLTNLGNALQPLAPLLATAGIDFLSGGAASGALASIFGGATDTAAALGTEGTTAAMGGGFGAGTAATTDAAIGSAMPAAATLTGDLAPLASAAPAVTPLAEIGAVAPSAAPAVTSLSSLGTDAASAGAGLTSAPAAAGLTAPVATDAASAGAGLTSGSGTTGLTATANPSLAAGAPLATSTPAAAGMGGGTGLTALSNIGATAGAPLAAAGAGVANMGGGTGLTVPAAGGGTVGAGGVTNPIDNSMGLYDSSTITAGGANGVGTTTGNTTPSWVKSLTDATGLTGTQLAALLQGGIGAVNAGNISSAIGAGVDAQAAANAKSQDILKGVYDTTTGYYKPYQTAGTNAINALDASQPYLTHQFDATDLQKGLAPNYDFMLQQGQMANQRAANVGGGALSGNTLQGLQNYTQNYAGNAYQNAFNNYQTQRNNIYNSLSGIANIGQNANAGAATAGANYGKGTVDLNTGLAGVRAAGMLGQAQAGASGTTGVGNSVLLSTLLNQINPINPVKP